MRRVRPSDEKRISFWTTELWKSWVVRSRVLGLVKGTSHPLLETKLLLIHFLLLSLSLSIPLFHTLFRISSKIENWGACIALTQRQICSPP